MTKLAMIPDDGGPHGHGRPGTVAKHLEVKIGYNYVHALIDDHWRLAYSEIPPDETAQRARRFRSALKPNLRAKASLASIERVMTDKAFVSGTPTR